MRKKGQLAPVLGLCGFLSASAFGGGGEGLVSELAFGEWSLDDSGHGVFAVTWDSHVQLAGVQFDFLEIEILSVSGGLAEAHGWTLAHSEHRVLGFFADQNGIIDPTKQPEVLLEVEFQLPAESTSVRFEGVVCAAPGGVPIDVIANDTIDFDVTPCIADINADGIVDGADLTILLGNWGPCNATTCQGDINEDSLVDGADLTALLGDWGCV